MLSTRCCTALGYPAPGEETFSYNNCILKILGCNIHLEPKKSFAIMYACYVFTLFSSRCLFLTGIDIWWFDFWSFKFFIFSLYDYVKACQYYMRDYHLSS
jgi:hypothetical protein